MEIDKKIINALNSETRVKILKALLQRRKMPSELSKELNLAGSTVVEHLKTLEEAGLVVRKEAGRKWIYYELTSTGQGLIKPKFPVQFVMVLALGLIFIFSGLVRYSTMPFSMMQRSSEAGGVMSGAPGSIATEPDYILIVLLAAGTMLILFSGYKILRK
jgi:DNA-binding transcriptional ArsR family regulator